ncbi:peptidase [Streptomyces montanisoli]|uniref:Peptidase n=1 Tax=Streptomyces montanisoli TaxID=2798581 RepID=A0A940M8J9_9ACTN|nr:peptidase [Streptomyces montanisoli]MBP0455906.1 peptidase [Streptomyces montanisoli]
MKISRTLATTVAAAVTAPVVLLSATPALADAKPAASTQAQHQKESGKPTIEQLEKAAAKAQKAYDDAVTATKAAEDAVEAVAAIDAPLTVAAREAQEAADNAATAKAKADKALADANAALDTLPPDATDEQKAAAQKAVSDAEAAANAAAAAKDAADAKSTEAAKARHDAGLAAFTELYKRRKAEKKALAAKKAADKALADAKAAAGGQDCHYESKLTTAITGLPSKITAGSTTDFAVHVTNGTDKTLGKVVPHLYFHATDKTGRNVIDDALHLQWSTSASPAWKSVGASGDAGSISPLKAGASADVKLRLKIDADAPAGEGLAFVAGDYVQSDDSCGGNLPTEYPFQIVAAGKDTGDGGAAKPGPSTSPNAGTKPQGGKSVTPIASTTPVATPTGTLAHTGSSSALPKLAAAAGAAVALGAIALVVGRRRKAGSAS